MNTIALSLRLKQINMPPPVLISCLTLTADPTMVAEKAEKLVFGEVEESLHGTEGKDDAGVASIECHETKEARDLRGPAEAKMHPRMDLKGGRSRRDRGRGRFIKLSGYV